MGRTQLCPKAYSLAPWWAALSACAVCNLHTTDSSTAPETGRWLWSLIVFWVLVHCHHCHKQFPWSFDSQLPFCFSITTQKFGAPGARWRLFPRTPTACHVWIQTQVMWQLAGSSEAWKQDHREMYRLTQLNFFHPDWQDKDRREEERNLKKLYRLWHSKLVDR